MNGIGGVMSVPVCRGSGGFGRVRALLALTKGCHRKKRTGVEEEHIYQTNERIGKF